MNSKKTLMINAIAKFLSGIVLIMLILFLPAVTLNYPNAWLFMALLFIPMFLLCAALLIKSPDLLAKRLNTKGIIIKK